MGVDLLGGFRRPLLKHWPLMRVNPKANNEPGEYGPSTGLGAGSWVLSGDASLPPPTDFIHIMLLSHLEHNQDGLQEEFF